MNKLTQENLRELLHRYMEGESTQEEQKLLKEYLDREQDLPADMIPYAQMFAIIGNETQTPSSAALDRFSEPQAQTHHRLIPLWPFIAAACVVAFAVIMLVPSHQKEGSMAIAYVEGKMLNNEAQALQMGQEALQEIFSNGNQEEQLSDLFNEQ